MSWLNVTATTHSIFMNEDARIYVAGHRGLVGSALLRVLNRAGYGNIVTRTHAELDLLNQQAVHDFFSSERPEYVILAAAKVGGIYANNAYPAEFIYDNIIIQSNVIHAAWQAGVERLLFLGSSCIYPRDCPQPIKEEYLLTGPLEPTNRPYAVAKISGIEMCWALNRQYGTSYACVMPTNLFGPGDNYDLETSHVIPALIRKTHEAKVSESAVVSIWGTGTPRREFLYSEDMAEACIHLLRQDRARLLENSDAAPPLFNIGCGTDMTIRELAELVCETVGYSGSLEFDPVKPDGTPRKLLDVSRMKRLGWTPRMPLQKGLSLAYQDFLEKLDASP